VGVSVDEECRMDTGWRPAGKYFELSLTSRFHLGEDHMYHDGPHCSFGLGLLHVNWSYRWCEKCWRDAHEGKDMLPY